MANMWMVPQGRVHTPVSGRDFVTVKARPGCQSIALSLPVRGRQALSISTFPPKGFFPLLGQTESPQTVVHHFQTPVGLSYGGPVPGSTVYAVTVEQGYESQHRGGLGSDITEKGQ